MFFKRPFGSRLSRPAVMPHAMRIGAVLLGVSAMAGCTKMQNYQLDHAEYRRECAGDISVHCRSMMIDLQVTKMQALGEMLDEREDMIVACKGQDAYDAGIRALENYIESIEDEKPNIFMRVFMSGVDIEFNPRFAGEPEFSRFMDSIEPCRNPASAPAATPPPAAPVVQAPSSSGEIGSDERAPDGKLDTVAGVLARTDLADGMSALTLDGRQLFHGDDANWQFPVRSFKLSGDREAILIASSGGRGNSCETLFFYLLADQQGVKPTPLFGTCAPTGTFTQSGDRITLTLPKMGGHSEVVYDGTTVIEDGVEVVMTEGADPSK